MPDPGEIVQVPLDVIRVTQNGQEYERVTVRGVYPASTPVPAAPEGAYRNTVQALYGRTMDVRALLIPAAPFGGAGEANWHPGPIRRVMTLDELRDQLWAIGCMARRAPLPYPPRPADQPDSLLALNASTAVRELVDDWEGKQP